MVWLRRASKAPPAAQEMVPTLAVALAASVSAPGLFTRIFT